MKITVRKGETLENTITYIQNFLLSNYNENYSLLKTDLNLYVNFEGTDLSNVLIIKWNLYYIKMA